MKVVNQLCGGASVALVALVAACGGGGGGGDSATPAPSVGASAPSTGTSSPGTEASAPGTGASAPTTSTAAVAGDYYSYAVTSTLNGASAPDIYYTVTFSAVPGDGTNQRVITYATGGALLRSYTATGAILSDSPQSPVGVTGYTCTNSPAAQYSPPYPRSVGQSLSQSISRSCAGSGALPLPSTIDNSVSVTTIEDVSLPLGTFSSFKADRVTVATTTSNVARTTESCWYSRTLGANMRCTLGTTNTPTGASTPTTTTTQETVLLGYGGPSKVAQGNAVVRFAGGWRVSFSGSESGSCSTLSVTTGGAVSGSCVGAVSGSFTVSGSVNASGALVLTTSNGGSLTGNLTTPYSGSGTWAVGGSSGSWSALHL